MVMVNKAGKTKIKLERKLGSSFVLNRARAIHVQTLPAMLVRPFLVSNPKNFDHSTFHLYKCR